MTKTQGNTPGIVHIAPPLDGKDIQIKHACAPTTKPRRFREYKQLLPFTSPILTNMLLPSQDLFRNARVLLPFVWDTLGIDANLLGAPHCLCCSRRLAANAGTAVGHLPKSYCSADQCSYSTPSVVICGCQMRLLSTGEGLGNYRTRIET